MAADPVIIDEPGRLSRAMMAVTEDPRKGTAVASLGGGGILVVVTYILFLLNADIPAPVVAAITGILGALGGMIVHSTTIKEDRAAFHLWVLSRLANHPPVVVSSPIPAAPLPRAQGQR